MLWKARSFLDSVLYERGVLGRLLHSQKAKNVMLFLLDRIVQRRFLRADLSSLQEERNVVVAALARMLSL